MFIALAYNILLPDPLMLAKGMQDKEIPLYYYYWKNDKNEYYLGKKRSDNQYSIWLYTEERKWKPFHNANAFDGFGKAGKIYESVSFEDGNIKLKMLNDSDDDNNSNGDENTPPNPNPAPPLPFSADTLTEDNDIKTYKVAYYFWIDKDGMSFLSKAIDNDKTSIWNYTLDRKWMPIYNAKAFDGFSPIGKTFESAKIDSSASNIKIGKFLNPLLEDFKLKISSNSTGDNNSLTSEFLMMTPQFSWTYDEQYKALNRAFILQITKKDGTLIYSTLTSNDANSTEEGKGKNGAILAIPMNAFCEKEYTHTNNTNDVKIEYEASIYGVYDTSILDKATCAKDIMDKDNYLAKDSMSIFIFPYSSVKVKNDVAYYESDKYIEGNVSFTFKDVKLKESITNLKSHINITNLPKDFSISKDLTITHKVMGDNILNVNIERSNIVLDKRNIGIEFLDTLFTETPKKAQKASMNIEDYKTPPSPILELP